MNDPLRTAPDSMSSKNEPSQTINAMLVASGRPQHGGVSSGQPRQSMPDTALGSPTVPVEMKSSGDSRQVKTHPYGSEAKHRLSVELSPELVCATQPDHPLAAAVYRIRTSLLLGQKSKAGPLMVAVVGAERGEGRTVLAANLAIACAQVGGRTVLIDGDMRHGRLHSIFNVSNEGGLARALTGHASVDEGMPVLKDHDLVLIPAGAAPDRQEVLSPARLKGVLSRLALQADVIIVDTPAWSAGADAQLIAAETGLALLVTRLGRASKDELRNLAEALIQTGARILAAPIA